MSLKQCTTLVWLLPFFLTTSYGQSIDYGSNKGKYVSVNGTKIYYEEYGQGSPLLLLHGGFGSIKDFKKVIPELSTRYRIIIPDTPGHGRSEQADSLSYPLLSFYFSRFIDLLFQDSLYIIGWSDGGNAALHLAAERPDKVKKVLVCGANSITDEGALDFFKQIDPAFVEAKQKAWLEEYLKITPQKKEWKKFINDMRNLWLTRVVIPEKTILQINIPVLIVLGDHDTISLEHGIQMHRAIKNSRFCVLPGTSHMVFDENPQLINFVSMDFFK